MDFEDDEISICENDMWSTVESGGTDRAAPCARGKHSATLLGGHVYVLGGRGAGGCVPLRDFWRYSLATSRWERLEARGEPPPALQEHSATAHGTRLYVFGGEAGSLSNETPLWIYDTEAQSWRKLPGPAGGRALRERGGAPRGRRGHSAHALKDCLLIYGGYKDLRGSTNELWAFHYESASWQQVRTACDGPARHRHAAVLHDNRLYVHGGQCDLRAAADLWHYDTLSRAWSAVRTPPKLSPSARCGHAGLRAGAHFYIFGGEANGHPTNELWRFHFATETWERVSHGARWPAARVDARALLVRAAGRAAGRAGRAEERAAPPARHEPSAGFLREISKLSGLHRRRAARCAYTVLAAERDSTESLPLAKSRSAHAIDERQPADGREAPPSPRRELAHEPLSVPDFAAVAPPASTSDYASAERVHGLSGSAGFSNPHYLGPDVRALGCALTPDSGLGPGDIELQELGERRARSAAPGQLHLLLVGGREPSHPALLQSPLSMWSFKLL